SDSIQTASRFVDIIMARLFKHSDAEEMAQHATVPVINALTDYTHPCQILADLQTIREKKGALKGLKLAYLGDGFNNVTHSLMFGCAKVGMDISVGSPAGAEYSPDAEVTALAEKIAAENGSTVTVTSDPVEAIKDADVVYTDSWMSYHIPKDQEEARVKFFMPYQVNAELMSNAKPDAIFMNCLSETESTYQKVMRILGGSTLLLAALLGTTGIFSIVSGRWTKKSRELLLLVLLCLITLSFDKLLLFGASRTQLIDPSYVNFMLPHALTPLLVTVLLGPVCGVISGLWTSLAAAILFDQNFGIFMLGFLVTIVSTHLGREVKNRASLFRAAIWIILTKIVFVLVLAVLNRAAAHVIFGQIASAAVSGLFSAFFAIVTIPLFELAFKITTDIKLLELSDMGHPLLQRLAIEAPGTYHHSLMVANLASQAAEHIGANALLTRVAAYFHDIGKMVKPEFFTENIQYRENPHDDLSPSMSTLVIMSHVKEGEELARRYRLPEQIIEGIREHHGTSLVSYFYHRAKTQSEDSDTVVQETDYRYAGPRPVTKEMAILALADSVEAASRSLEKATPNRIASLVDEIVDKKVRDRQLANSELTLAQLTEIKNSFVFTLTNMLHGRVAYPKDEDKHSKPSD
ncbi:HDIG domain-containing metalloprotein, partial [Verrucomicrobiota bacterium]